MVATVRPQIVDTASRRPDRPRREGGGERRRRHGVARGDLQPGMHGRHRPAASRDRRPLTPPRSGPLRVCCATDALLSTPAFCPSTRAQIPIGGTSASRSTTRAVQTAPVVSRRQVVVVGGGNAGLCAAISARGQGAEVTLYERAPESAPGGNSAFTGGLMRAVYDGADDLRALMPDLTGEEVRPQTSVRTPKGLPRRPRPGHRLPVRPRSGRGAGHRQPRCSAVDAGPRRPVPAELWPAAFRVGHWFTFWGARRRRRGRWSGPCRRPHQGRRAAGRARCLRRRGEEPRARRHRGARHTGPHRRPDRGAPPARSCSRPAVFEANAAWRARYLGPTGTLPRCGGPASTPATGSAWRSRRVRRRPATGRDATQWAGTSTHPSSATSPSATGTRSTAIRSASSSMSWRAIRRRGRPTSATSPMPSTDACPRTAGPAGMAGVRQPRPPPSSGRVPDPGGHPAAGRLARRARDRLEGVDPAALPRNGWTFNAAVRTEVPFDPNVKDGRGTIGLDPPKSNWANPLDSPPFEAYTVTCGITFTFGGVRIDTGARVLSVDGPSVPNLFACGEMAAGIFYLNYPGGSGLTAGTVFGRIAGRGAGQRGLVSGARHRPDQRNELVDQRVVERPAFATMADGSATASPGAIPRRPGVHCLRRRAGRWASYRKAVRAGRGHRRRGRSQRAVHRGRRPRAA